jgi:DNA-binding MarR family transcriptional regulator
MAETYQLKDILERFERSQKRLDRDEHFNAYCMLKLAGMKTHAEREEMLKILQLIHEGHSKGLPSFTEPEIARRTGLSIHNVRRYVDKLSRKELLTESLWSRNRLGVAGLEDRLCMPAH